MIILNLTQHVGTPEQGVVEPNNKEEINKLLTFYDIPTEEELHDRAEALTDIAIQHLKTYINTSLSYDIWPRAMIGGAPYLMGYLEKTLLYMGIYPVYAFSRRESVERLMEDGKVVKSTVFKHIGFVPCYRY